MHHENRLEFLHTVDILYWEQVILPLLGYITTVAYILISLFNLDEGWGLWELQPLLLLIKYLMNKASQFCYIGFDLIFIVVA